MNIKKCAKCKKDKVLTDFRIRKKSKDGLQSWCKECSNKGRMESYYKNPLVNYLNRKRNVKIKKEFIKEYLKKHPCVDCGYNNILGLQFDHVRGEKKYDVMSLAHQGRSLEIIKEEIKKCEIRCANCHQIKNHKTD